VEKVRNLEINLINIAFENMYISL